VVGERHVSTHQSHHTQGRHHLPSGRPLCADLTTATFNRSVTRTHARALRACSNLSAEAISSGVRIDDWEKSERFLLSLGDDSCIHLPKSRSASDAGCRSGLYKTDDSPRSFADPLPSSQSFTSPPLNPSQISTLIRHPLIVSPSSFSNTHPRRG